MHLAERAGGDGEVLAEGGDRAAADIAGADHDAVGRKVFLRRGAGLCDAADVHADFLEGAFLEQRGETFARRHLALLVTGAGLLLAAASENLGLPVAANPRGPWHPASCRDILLIGSRGPVRSAAVPPGSR